MHFFRKKNPQLSVVVVFYNMTREAPRTLYSLSRAYQLGIDDLVYEVIALDHGSPEPLDEALVTAHGPEFRLHRLETESKSPVVAINNTVAAASGRFVMVNIDGARILSPGVLKGCMSAFALYPNAFVHTLAWHLGPGLQNQTMLDGYNQTVEDRLLDDCGWINDGYRLFEVSAIAGSSAGGFFSDISESNCFALPRHDYLAMQGFNPGFQAPGAGLANLEFYSRAMTNRDLTPVRLLGEGSFHQFHGGVATNVPREDHPWDRYMEEHQRLFGKELERVTNQRPIYLGTIHPAAKRFMFRQE